MKKYSVYKYSEAEGTIVSSNDRKINSLWLTKLYGAHIKIRNAVLDVYFDFVSDDTYFSRFALVQFNNDSQSFLPFVRFWVNVKGG